jgi:hypothetical protein
MTHKDGFMDNLKHLVFEDEPETQKSTHSSAPSAAPAKAPLSAEAVIQPTTVADNDEVYRRILAKTDFDSTEVGATIQKFLAPLQNLPMDAALRFKTALAQAKAINGLTEVDFLATFDSLKATLQKEREAFSAKAQQFAEREINGRSARINEITSEINQLQQQLGQLSTELVEAQGKAARAQGQFTAASERRTAEIDQQKAQYAALLK